MSRKNYFDNTFHNCLHDNNIVKNYINEDGVSAKFNNILQEFKKETLNILTKKMKKEVLCDGTVYTGSAGLSLFFLMRYIKYDQDADNNLQLALKYLDLKNLKGHRISFLCGDAGPIAIATVISYKLGTKRPENLPDFEALSQRLLDLNRLMKKSPDELLYGAAGYLYSLLFVKSNIGENIIPSKNIEKVIDHILTSGKLFSAQVKSNSPLLWQWHDKIYLGAAHGVGGILYLLLQARSYINQQDIETLIKPTLDWLAHKQLPSGNFPSSLGSSSGDRLVQWCHGAPGFVHLFVLAHQIFKDDKYLQIAIKCCNVIWERGLCTKGYSICHGVSGNAYSFICLYQATKDPLYLFRACCFMDWCVTASPGTEQHKPDRPTSLFEGLLGRLYLAEDIARLEDAKFPAFTL